MSNSNSRAGNSNNSNGVNPFETPLHLLFAGIVDPVGDSLNPIAEPDPIDTSDETGNTDAPETVVSGPTVTTDQDDYAPGSTATITATGFEVGSTIRFEIVDSASRPGDDQDIDVYTPIVVTDGVTVYNELGLAIGGDLDGVADGNVTTTWFVPIDDDGTGSGTPDALNATLNLTATGTGADGRFGTSDDQVATYQFDDAGGDFKLDFAAAAPWTYDHNVGGGSWDDKTIGRGLDVVESLQGGDFKSGEIVSYFLEIAVDSTAVEKDQAIQVKVGFLASTTGLPGVGHDWIQNIQVNYVSERVDYTDTPPPSGSLGGLNNRRTVVDSANTGSRNDGGSYVEFVEQGFETKDGIALRAGNDGLSGASTVSNSLGQIASLSDIYAPSYTDLNGTHWLYDLQMARLYAVFNVYDLDPGEKPVVRIDVHLGDDGKSPTGNLQGFLLDAQVISDTAGTTTINTGRQTIPFKLTKDIELENNSYGLNLEKYVTTDSTDSTTISGFTTANQFDQYLSENRNKSVDVTAGTTVRYIFKLTNNGTGTLQNISLFDDKSNLNGGITPSFTGTATVTEGSGTSATITEYTGLLVDSAGDVLGGQLPGSVEDDITLIDARKTNNSSNGVINANDFNFATGVLKVFGFSSNPDNARDNNGDNDLAAGATAYVIYEYFVPNGTVSGTTIRNEAVAIGYKDPNGGNQQGLRFGAIDSAVVNVVNTAPTRLGSISGKVYVDLDNDFDRDANETGLAGYRVELLDGNGEVIACLLYTSPSPRD